MRLKVRNAFLSNWMLMVCIMIFSHCTMKYNYSYVAPHYFFSLPQSKQRVSKTVVVVHGRENSYYLLNANMNDSFIQGKPQLISDTTNTVYLASITATNKNQNSPVFVYTSLSDVAIQGDLKTDTSGRIFIHKKDIRTIKVKPNEPVRKAMTEPKKLSTLAKLLIFAFLSYIAFIIFILIIVFIQMPPGQ